MQDVHFNDHKNSIKRRVASILEQNFEHVNVMGWPESKPIDLDSMQIVHLSMLIEDAFDLDLADVIIPHSTTLNDFVTIVESAKNRQQNKNAKRSVNFNA